MLSWQSLYTSPVQLTPQWGHERIFAPQSYAALRTMQTVPVALHEAMVIARNFVLCWQIYEDRPRLVALLSLLPGALQFPAFADLPLVLQAYPIVIEPETSEERALIMVDKAIPDKPTDIGAPILMDNHKLSAGAEMRIRAAVQARKTLPQADDLTDDLMTHGLLEPWPLKFPIGPELEIRRDDLLVIASEQRNSPALFSIIERHGIQAGLFMGVHRASLFRINWLLSQARGHIRALADKAKAEAQAGELFR